MVAKGFSFVLVTVVMVMMVVFGLLSLSSSSADLRLAQKAASTQQIYYQLDSSGQLLAAACGGAAAQSSVYASSFMANRQYTGTLPADFYKCLLPLVTEVNANPGSSANLLLQRGVFFYELEKQLDNLEGNYHFTCSVDQNALSEALRGQSGGSTQVAYIYSTITSSISSNYSIKIILVCDFGDLSSTPVFMPKQWESAVSIPEINSNPKINVWNGK